MCCDSIMNARAIISGIVTCLPLFLILPAPGSVAASRIPSPTQMRPTIQSGKQPSQMLEFNRKLANYKETLSKLRADVIRLQDEDKQLGAILQNMQRVGAQSDITMIKLQSLMSQRQSVIQFASNVFQKLSESNNEIIRHMK